MIKDLQQVTVYDQRKYSEKVLYLTLEKTMDFIPGQVIGLALSAEKELRYYSIASEPGQKIGILYDLIETGVLTPQLNQLKNGMELYMTQPFGSFLSTKENEVWIATGTGIAPFLSMAKAGLGYKKTLIHGAKKKEDFLFSEVFRSQKEINYIRCSSQERGEGLIPGRLTQYLISQDFSPDTNFLLCGGPQMVVDVREILISKNISHDRILSEIYF